MLVDFAHRIITELGPWLWMVSGFIFMSAEFFSGRSVMLSLGLGAMITGTFAVLGESGVWPETSNAVQSAVYLGSAFAIFLGIKFSANSA